MIIRKKKILKIISLFLVSNFLLNIVLPLLPIYNLNNAKAEGMKINDDGVQVPQMVDLKTGDMNYSVPFINLPGSYNFNLSYHAGITPMENSSWIGLGWQLEAGEITRTVNGYADDHNGNGYENYYFGKPLPSSPNKQYNPYGCLKGYDLTLYKTVGSALPETAAFDTYTSHFSNDVSQSSRSSIVPGNPNPISPIPYSYTPLTVMDTEDSYFGGTFPNYDGYFVSGNNLSGYIQPMILENPTLYSSSRDTRATNRQSYICKKFTQQKPSFRFVNDFSNSYKVSNTAEFVSGDPLFQNNSINFGTNQLGYQATIANSGAGYNSSDMRLAGSRHIEYFTNGEIYDGSIAKQKGFIAYQGLSDGTSVSFANGLYNYAVKAQIGGFSITDEAGNTYHYGLPVYAYKKYSYTKTRYGFESVIENDNAFAYKWLLTSITGADFIDKNSNGFADENDLGSWTNFVYGKWTDQYDERTPVVSNHKSENGTESYSTVKKEVYYLDAAYSRMHAVLFPKNNRADTYSTYPSSYGLRLSSGILLTSDGLKTIRNIKSFSTTSIFGDINAIKGLYSTSGFGSVLDIQDLQNISTSSSLYAGLIIQESKLTQDYGLCADWPNSTPSGFGKLTLKSVSYFGRNNSSLTPNYDFEYELSAQKTTSLTITNVPTDAGFGTRRGRVYLSNSPSILSQGQIVKFSVSSVTYYAALVKKVTNNDYDVTFLGASIPGSAQKSISVTATETKNPPYTNGYYDVWGYFKSDYDYTPNLLNKGRRTSVASSVGVDSWSLRKISTPTGAIIQVEYESDSYSDIAASEGKRILNVHPNIGFTPASAYKDGYSSLVNDGTYYLGNYFAMSAFDSLSSYNFKLRFLDEDATTAIANNITIGQIIEMKSLTSMVKAGPVSYFSTPGANVTVVSTGIDADNVPYIIVNTPQNFLVIPNTNYHSCLHLASYIIVRSKKMLQYGGGVRVKKVSLTGNDGVSSYNTGYTYNNRASLNSSGSITFDPNGYDAVSITGDQIDNTGYPFPIYQSALYNDMNRDAYRKPYAYLLNNFESIRYFVPPTGVQYQFVSEVNMGNGATEKIATEYQFETFKNSFIKKQILKDSMYVAIDGTGGLGGGSSRTSRFSIHSDFTDLSSRAGQLLGIKKFDLQNKLIYRQVFNYSDDNSLPLDQGVVGQVFHEKRQGDISISSQVDDNLIRTNFKNNTYNIVSSFNRYPTVLLSVETYDYLKGTREKIENKAFDLYSGAPTEIITQDSYGNFYKKVKVPAYKKSVSSSMGLKMLNGRNMLLQVGEQYTYKVDPNNFDINLGLMSTTATLWSTNTKYRKYNSSTGLYENVLNTEDAGTVQSELTFKPEINYKWNSPKVNADGSYNSFTPLNYLSPGSNWIQVSKVKLSDPYSGILNWTDVNGKNSSRRLTKKNSLVLAEAENSSYGSFTYTSFEDFNNDNAPFYYSYLDGELSAGYSPSPGLAYGRTSNVPSVTPHTGNYVCMVLNSLPGSQFKTSAIASDSSSLQAGRTYRASVWVHGASDATASLSVNINGSTSGTAYNASYTVSKTQYVARSGNWYLLNLDFPIPIDYVSSGGSTNNVTISLNSGGYPSYFDDFSFHPIDSDITGYVYDETTMKILYTIDKDNFYSRYEYDDNSRLKAIYKETINGEVKIKEVKYNYVK